MIIKHQALAKRCEICHQPDLFDPLTTRCFRCVQFESLLTKPRPAKPNRPAGPHPFDRSSSFMTNPRDPFSGLLSGVICAAVLAGVLTWGLAIPVASVLPFPKNVLNLYGVFFTLTAFYSIVFGIPGMIWGTIAWLAHARRRWKNRSYSRRY